MATSTDKVFWYRAGYYPLYYGFCPSEKAWTREKKRLALKADLPYPTSYGYCYQINKQGDLKTNAAVVFVSEQASKDKKIELIGLLVHEATHVWQYLRSTLGEDDPSAEFEAYSVQNIVMDLLEAYEKSRNKVLRS